MERLNSNLKKQENKLSQSLKNDSIPEDVVDYITDIESKRKKATLLANVLEKSGGIESKTGKALGSAIDEGLFNSKKEVGYHIRMFRHVEKEVKKEKEEVKEKSFQDLSPQVKQFRFFRFATFLFERHLEKDPNFIIELKKEIKELKDKYPEKQKFKKEKIKLYIQKILQVWNYITIHNLYHEGGLEEKKKQTDLDAKGVLFVMKACGLNIGDLDLESLTENSNIKLVEQGDFIEGSVMADTADMDGISVIKREEAIKYKDTKGNEDKIREKWGAFIDHHSKVSEYGTSATKFMLELMVGLGLIQPEIEINGEKVENTEYSYMKAIVDFINREDNKKYNITEKQFLNSHKTLFGYKSLIFPYTLLILFKDKKIKEKFFSEKKDLEFLELSEEDLQRLRLISERSKIDIMEDIKKEAGINSFQDYVMNNYSDYTTGLNLNNDENYYDVFIKKQMEETTKDVDPVFKIILNKKSDIRIEYNSKKYLNRLKLKEKENKLIYETKFGELFFNKFNIIPKEGEDVFLTSNYKLILFIDDKTKNSEGKEKNQNFVLKIKPPEEIEKMENFIKDLIKLEDKLKQFGIERKRNLFVRTDKNAKKFKEGIIIKILEKEIGMKKKK